MSGPVKRLFYVVFLAGGTVALVLCVIAVDRVFGVEVAGISVLVAPLVVLIMPWWSALAEGDWLLLKLVPPRRSSVRAAKAFSPVRWKFSTISASSARSRRRAASIHGCASISARFRSAADPLGHHGRRPTARLIPTS